MIKIGFTYYEKSDDIKEDLTLNKITMRTLFNVFLGIYLFVAANAVAMMALMTVMIIKNLIS